MGLNLEVISPGLRARATQAFEARDVLGFLCYADNHNALALVFDNSYSLRERGMYEKALLEAYSGTRTNHHHWSPDTLRFMFDRADRARLRAAGDPFPHKGPFTLYRGVAGVGRARRLRGLSWTASLERAWWFARRFPKIANPKVFRVSVAVEDVLAYINDHYRKEGEFLVLLPKTTKPVKVSAPKEAPGLVLAY